MASGTINGSTTYQKSYMSFGFNWSSVSNGADANTSTLTINTWWQTTNTSKKWDTVGQRTGNYVNIYINGTLSKEIPNSFVAGQFDNMANPKAHKDTTGPEIWEQTDGKVDIVISAVGTGGTITGIGEYLKSKNPNIKVIAVEPSASPVLSGGEAGSHKIQGIGAGFIPKNLDLELVDDFYAISGDKAYQGAKELAKELKDSGLVLEEYMGVA